ncbi:MAG: M20/M25/M40 family metallo-hydrolase [bacterium]|nr:M20/M25/M40 family metallo-hydrolase [bacterium]
MINQKRLVEEFLTMVSVDSPSRDEADFAAYLSRLLRGLGAETVYDSAENKTKGNCSNLIAKIRGNKPDAPVILLNAHMDTVSPGRGIKPVIKDGVIHSDGDTILGSDDKSGIAIIIEVIRSLRDNSLPHGDIEILFTVCEEVGLLGAKHFDPSSINAAFGYSLDSSDSCKIVYAAPASNHIKFTVHGVESHAGLAPEKGISAIKLAAQAIAGMPLGRIDDETTANIGTIQGGTATNIVAGTVIMEGEARSHNIEKLTNQTKAMVDSVKKVVHENKLDGNEATLDLEISMDYPLMLLNEDCPSISLARKAAINTNKKLELRIGGGGSDANILNDKGVEMAIIGTGMKNVHTTDEQIKIDDMEKTADFLLEIIQTNCK